jgi:hypothetical protein
MQKHVHFGRNYCITAGRNILKKRYFFACIFFHHTFDNQEDDQCYELHVSGNVLVRTIRLQPH